MPEHFMVVLTKNNIANSHGVLQNSFIRIHVYVYTLRNISQEPTSLIGHDCIDSMGFPALSCTSSLLIQGFTSLT